MNSSQLLISHSYFRWIVLTTMLIQGIWMWRNARTNRIVNFNGFKILTICTFIYNIQLLLGWSLYLNSIIVDSFWQDIQKGIKNRQLRFFGLEHMSMMSLAILLINLSTYRVYKGINQGYSFKRLWKLYIWIFLIILSSLPWSFSPLTNRPNFR